MLRSLLRRALSSSSQANALRQSLQATVAKAGAQKQPLIDVYEELVRQGALRQDAEQRRVAKRLDKLSRLLQTYTPPPPPRPATPPPLPPSAPASSPAASAAEIKPHTPFHEQQRLGRPEPPPPPPPSQPPTPSDEPPRKVLRGMYIHGQVGTGKSLLMDLFFHHCSLPHTHKRRVHFHAFMLEVHARIHAWKQQALKEEGRRMHIDLRPERNAIKQIAREIGQQATVLCFDEFQVTDVADAVIMASLFGELWSECGVVMVATSNRAPDELYLDGINRPYFLPFIDLLKRQCVCVDMDSERDHRQAFAKKEGTYFYPLNDETQHKLDTAFLALTGGKRGHSIDIPVMMGRTLTVPEAVDNVCRFTFEDLCAKDVFAADYKAICENFEVVVLEGVKRLSTEKHNEARRFITLVDVLYEKRTRLVMSAEVPVQELFKETKGENISTSISEGSLGGETRVIEKNPEEEEIRKKEENSKEDELLSRYVDAAQELVVPEGELASVKELGFAFQRAASRLQEMASYEYLEEAADGGGRREGEGGGREFVEERRGEEKKV